MKWVNRPGAGGDDHAGDQAAIGAAVELLKDLENYERNGGKQAARVP